MSHPNVEEVGYLSFEQRADAEAIAVASDISSLLFGGINHTNYEGVPKSVSNQSGDATFGLTKDGGYSLEVFGDAMLTSLRTLKPIPRLPQHAASAGSVWVGSIWDGRSSGQSKFLSEAQFVKDVVVAMGLNPTSLAQKVAKETVE